MFVLRFPASLFRGQVESPGDAGENPVVAQTYRAMQILAWHILLETKRVSFPVTFQTTRACKRKGPLAGAFCFLLVTS